MVLEMVWTWTHPKVLAKEVDVQFRCSVVRAPLMLQSALEAACTLPGSSNFPQHLMFRHVALQTVSLIGYVLSFFIFLPSCAKAEAKLIGGIKLPKTNAWKIL